MKKYLAVFTCAENSPAHEAWKKLDAQAQQDRSAQGLIAQKNWSARYGDRIIYAGTPLSERTKKVDNSGIHDIASQMGNFLIIEASSPTEAAEMFIDHPHFALFPGDAVEVLEFLDQPRG